MVEDSIAVADAHPYGARPFARENYIEKLRTLADGIVAPAEQERFLTAAQSLATLDDLGELNVRVTPQTLQTAPETGKGVF